MRHVTVLFALLLMLFQPGNGDLKVIKLNGMDCGPEGKPGGSAGQKDLNEHKNRYQEPTEAEVDPHVSLAAMLAPGNDVKRFDQEKAAKIRGYVVNVKTGGTESCNCGATDPDERDTHIELGLVKDAPETQRVVVEVSPRARRLKGSEWKTEALHRDIKDKWVEVTGWLTFDTAHIKQAENTHPGNKTNWRATCWEIHPVMDITILPGPPAEVAKFDPVSFTALQSLHASHLKRAPKGQEAIDKLHMEHLSRFRDDELKEADEETEARKKHQ